MLLFKKKSHEPVISVDIKGGLGNQLFQFANAVNLAIEFNRPIKLLDSSYSSDLKRIYLLNYWGLMQNTIYKVELDSKGKLVFVEVPDNCNCELEILNEANFYFTKIELGSLSQKCFKIDGYWQSERYFYGVRNEMVHFLNSMLLSSKPTLSSILMHVRLGDFISEKATILEHGVLGSNYYEKALSICHGPRNADVVSDEPSRVEQYLGKNLFNKLEIQVLDAKNEFETFNDFKKYEFLILANSTFSWWGAYLSEAHVVIAPRAVFSEVGLRKRNVCDFYPSSWVLV